MTQHTPGPWKWAPRYREDGSMLALLLETEHRPVAWNHPTILAVREDWIGAMSRDRGPDAALIAAAPALLDALEAVLPIVAAVHEVPATRYQQARNAIALARGEQVPA